MLWGAGLMGRREVAGGVERILNLRGRVSIRPASAADKDLPLRRPRILLIDWDPDSRVIYATMLEHRGFEVVVADRCDQVDEHAGATLDAIVIDPGACGRSDLKALRSAAARHQVPILALTYRVTPEELAALRAEGFDAVLLRPLAPEDLVTCVQRVLPQGSGDGAASSR